MELELRTAYESYETRIAGIREKIEVQKEAIVILEDKKPVENSSIRFLEDKAEIAEITDVFGWAKNDYGYDVEVVTCGFTKQVVSTFGITITVDKIIDEINTDEYAALAIPGGFEEYDETIC